MRDQYDPFEIGDVVTRDGTDEHLVYEVSPSMIGVVCIKDPSTDWTKIGEVESNVSRRYEFLYKHCNYIEKLKDLLEEYNLDDYDKDIMNLLIKRS